jgi:hypothetical protein
MITPAGGLKDLTEAAVAAIPAGRGGTGFFVAPGTIITCAHVVAVGEETVGEVTVDWNDLHLEGSATARPPATGPGRLWEYPDLCVISLYQPPADHPVVILGESRNPTDVSLTGFSDVYERSSLGTTSGRVVGFETLGRGRAWRIADCEMPEGMSGGPVLDLTHGVVCGLAKTTRMKDANRGGLAIPATAIADEFPAVWRWNQEEGRRRNRQWKALRDALGDRVDRYGLTESEQRALSDAVERLGFGQRKLTQVWQKVVGPHVPKPVPPFEVLNTLVDDLADRPLPGLNPLIKLFEVFADLFDRDIETRLRKHADDLAVRNAQERGLEEYRAQHAVRERPVIVIRVDPYGQNPEEEVNLRAWSYADCRAPAVLVNEEPEYGPHPLGRIKEAILTVLRREIGAWPTMIQLVLPDRMLDEAIERWELDAESPLGVDYPVVVRFAEWPEDESEARRARARLLGWKDDFLSLRMPVDPASWEPHWVGCHDPRNARQLNAMLNGAGRPPFLAMTGWHKGEPVPMPVAVARRKGVPVILWRHERCLGCEVSGSDGTVSDCPGSVFRKEVTTYLSGLAFGELPEKIRSIRAGAAESNDEELGLGVTILWDDPDRRPWEDPPPNLAPRRSEVRLL